MKRALDCGAGGFVGGHLVNRPKAEGLWVRGVDLKSHEYTETVADDFMIGDLRDPDTCVAAVDTNSDEVYQLAADMGGAGFIFSGKNNADIMHNSALINLNMLDACRRRNVGNIFYSSSACAYPAYNQEDPDNPKCCEGSAYTAAPDREYGWEKLFSGRLYLAYSRNHGLKTHIARFHNIYGPEGEWKGGREKAPAAMYRKVAMAQSMDCIAIRGDGGQTRSFIYIDECVDGMTRLLRSDFSGAVNIGSEEMVTINQLVDTIADIASKQIQKRHVDGPLRVGGRTSDNRLVRDTVGWAPERSLREGLAVTYAWIEKQLENDEHCLKC